MLKQSFRTGEELNRATQEFAYLLYNQIQPHSCYQYCATENGRQYYEAFIRLYPEPEEHTDPKDCTNEKLDDDF